MKSRGSRAADWKSTVLNDLLAFLLVDVLLDHLVGDRARTGRQVTRAQKCCPQNFLRKCGNSCNSTSQLIPFSHSMIRLEFNHLPMASSYQLGVVEERISLAREAKAAARSFQELRTHLNFKQPQPP